MLISVISYSLFAESSSVGTNTQSWCFFMSSEPDNSFFAAKRPPRQRSESVSEEDDELGLLSTFFVDFLSFFLFFFDFLGLWCSSELEDFLLLLSLQDFAGGSGQTSSESSGGPEWSRFGRDGWVWITWAIRPEKKKIVRNNRNFNFL